MSYSHRSEEQKRERRRSSICGTDPGSALPLRFRFPLAHRLCDLDICSTPQLYPTDSSMIQPDYDSAPPKSRVSGRNGATWLTRLKERWLPRSKPLPLGHPRLARRHRLQEATSRRRSRERRR